MIRIKTLIVDDEPLARARIGKLLQQREEIEILGEARNGKEAADLIERYRPELLLLDVQMPDWNAFELLKRFDENSLPFIIFVSAFDEFALKAFDVHAIDYVLKPFDDERFYKALDQAVRRITLRQNHILHLKMLDVLEEHRKTQFPHLMHFELRYKGRLIQVKVDDVSWINADGNYVTLHTSQRKHLYRSTIQHLVEELPPYFLRIHRSYIINANYLHECRYKGNNEYRFMMQDGTEILSGRSFKSNIDAFLTQKEEV